MIYGKPRFWACLLFVFLLLLAGTATAKESRLRILHLNDFHGFVQPHRPGGAQELQGGIAYLAGRVAELRRQQPTLLLSAGDMIQGDNWANLFQGASVITLMNAMRFDAMAVGNHEFDYGRIILEKLIARARFPVLGANVRGVRGLKARTLKTKDGLRVGIIGVVTPETPQYTHPRNVKGLVFTSPEEAVQQNIRALKGRADLILVLSHLGYARDRQLAARVKGIDVIVGGHSHTKLTRPEVVAGVLIVQAYEHGKTLGVLDLTWRDGKIAAYAGQLLEIRPTPGQEDPGIGVLVARYQERLDRVLGEQVGRTEVDLNGEQEQVRTTETNLGNLVTDVLRARAGADVALINGGSIKKSIIRGKILRQDVYAALPFNNYLVAFRLTGRELREALEHGVSGVEEQMGRFPQVSGLAFTYKPSAPPGLRVQEVLVGGGPLQPEREYTVATLDFMAAGGDGYRVFGKVMGGVRGIAAVEAMMSSPQVVYIDPGRWVREDVIDYLKAHPAIAPRVEGRIRGVN